MSEKLVGQVFSHENVMRVIEQNHLIYKCSDCELKGQELRTFDQHVCNPYRNS